MSQVPGGKYKICTARTPDGSWKWEVYYGARIVAQSEGGYRYSTHTATRWGARRKGRKAAWRHNERLIREYNPQRQCEEVTF